jgi:uncharacterized membrane protein
MRVDASGFVRMPGGSCPVFAAANQDHPPMEAALKLIAVNVALGCELAAVAVLALAAAEAMAGVMLAAFRRADMRPKKLVWVRFASWIILALEFTLAADIARTVVEPSWRQLAELAAIATIRTVLNLFLERDVEIYARTQSPEGE